MKLLRIIILIFSLFTTACSSLLFHPDKGIHYDPIKLGYKEEDIEFRSKDGTKLHGWFIKSTKDNKGTIVQFHGNGQNLSSHYVTLSWLTNEGYNLFIFDYRGYGKSEGEPDQKGLNLDGVAALNKGLELHSKHSPKGKFIVYGQSLGVPVSLRALEDFKNKDKVNLIVIDSGFSSYKWAFAQTMAKYWLILPFSFIPLITVSDEYSPNIKKLNTPALVIHDRYDPIVKFSNGIEIFNKIPHNNKWLWIIEEGTHISVFFVKNHKYRKIFLDLLKNL